MVKKEIVFEGCIFNQPYIPNEIDNLKYCTKCGKEVNSTDKFCANCGFNLASKTSVKKQTESSLHIEELWRWIDDNGFDYDSLPRDKDELLNLTEFKFEGGDGLTEIPKEIGLLTNLTKLDLTRNQLTEIPKEIGLLSNLTTLGLGGNQLTEIPKEIGLLSNLTTLGLRGNHLTEIPKEIGLLTNLTKLDLGANNLNEIPKEIGLLTNLSKLNIYKNKLSNIPKEIGKLVNLAEISLQYNNLTKIPKEIGFLSNLSTSDLDKTAVIRLKKYSEQEKQELINYLEIAADRKSKHGKRITADLTRKKLADGWYAEVPVDPRLGGNNTYWQHDIYLRAAVRYLKGITPNTKEALDPSSDYNKEFRRQIDKINSLNGFYSIRSNSGKKKYEAKFIDGKREGEWTAWHDNGEINLNKKADTLIDKEFREQNLRQIHERLRNKKDD